MTAPTITKTTDGLGLDCSLIIVFSARFLGSKGFRTQQPQASHQARIAGTSSMQREDGANVNVAVDVDRAASLALTQATAALSDSLTQRVTAARRTPSPSQENSSIMSRGQHSIDLSEDSRDAGDLEQSFISNSTASGVQAHANHFNEAEEVTLSTRCGGSVLARAGLLNARLDPFASPNCATASVACLAGLPTPSSFAGTLDGEAQPVPPVRSARELCSITGSSPSSRSTSFTSNTMSWKASEEPADSLSRLLIAARRSPSSSRESSFGRPGRARRGDRSSRDSRESSFREMSF